jgi:2-polyprenyl-6-methoxyphenol hydroxylase-like FAD-dependent oxidoreductase
MRIAVVGAGAAGLLFSLLVKRRFPAWEVEVYEQNPEGATYGFGVVFSDGALAFLERDEPEMLRTIEAGMERWPMQRLVHRGERVDVEGNGFSAIGRLALQQVLQGLNRRAGVELRYGRPVSSLDEFAGADLVVGADGSNSMVRSALAPQFGPRVEVLTNRFAWYGTAQPFDCLTLTFRTSEHGAFVAHHYRHAPSMSTFVVECGDATWRRAGLDRMDDASSRAYCESVFAPDLGGHPLATNKSVWRQFPLVRNERWVARRPPGGHAVLLGDALRTVHFSIGSGTRLAFEDAIALERAFAECGDDVRLALEAFERERRPVVEKLLAAANASSYWYERFSDKMNLEPWELAYDYMTRSGRMSEERLRALAPKFMARVDAGRSGSPRSAC